VQVPHSSKANLLKLLHDLPPNAWTFGIVEELYQGANGLTLEGARPPPELSQNPLDSRITWGTIELNRVSRPGQDTRCTMSPPSARVVGA
jgi:hypothetical protein